METLTITGTIFLIIIFLVLAYALYMFGRVLGIFEQFTPFNIISSVFEFAYTKFKSKKTK